MAEESLAELIPRQIRGGGGLACSGVEVMRALLRGVCAAMDMR
jgi:hypothetical protein